MCQFESKEEACESLCFHSKSDLHGVAKASGVRRCAARFRGAWGGGARDSSNSGRSVSLKFLHA